MFWSWKPDATQPPVTPIAPEEAAQATAKLLMAEGDSETALSLLTELVRFRPAVPVHLFRDLDLEQVTSWTDCTRELLSRTISDQLWLDPDVEQEAHRRLDALEYDSRPDQS